jgi:O-antigen ligase
MNLIWAFCLYMTFIYLPYDLFWKPVAEDQEVWFGILLEGWAAKLTAPLHWAIYAAGAYGFWKMSRWMWPWAAVYVAQVAIGMFVWSLTDARGGGAVFAVIAGAVFAIPTVALWRARDRFQRGVAPA